MLQVHWYLSRQEKQLAINQSVGQSHSNSDTLWNDGLRGFFLEFG